MKKDVDIVINQVPVSVTFSCPHCCNDVVIDYKIFENITGKDLDGILDNSSNFNCPKCNGNLATDGIELD